MAPPFRDPVERYGHLQRAYMTRADESLLDEITDLGHLMAVTGVPVESVVEVHGESLTAALERSDGRSPAVLIRDAAVCLSELLVAWRVAAETIAAVGTGGGSTETLVPESPCFLWRAPGERLGDTDDPVISGFSRALNTAGREADIDAAVANRRILSFEFPSLGGDKQLRAVLCPFRDGSAILGIHDVTAGHAAAEAMFQRRKLASLGQLAGGIAHELNNLLQPILSTAQFIAEDYPSESALIADINTILDSTRAAAEVVRGVLAFARRPAPQLIPLPLAEAVTAELARLRNEFPAAVLSADLADCAAAAVAGNPGELRQVLGNLIRNAVDAAGPNGKVSVNGECRDLDAPAAVRLRLPAGHYVCLSVADNGPGVDKATADQIFDPFFTTKDIGHGTGLGLAVVRSIVRSWKGDIVLRERRDPGAIFDIYLPAVEDAQK